MKGVTKNRLTGSERVVVSLSLPEKLNTIVGREAKRNFSTRSEFIRDALQYYLLSSGAKGFYQPTKAELKSIDHALNEPRGEFYPLEKVLNEVDAKYSSKSKTPNRKSRERRSSRVAA